MENLNNFNEMNVVNSFGKTVSFPFSVGFSKPATEPGSILFFNRSPENTDYNKTFLKTVINSYEEIKNVLTGLKNNFNLEIEDDSSVIQYLLMNIDAIEPLKELTEEARKRFLPKN